METNILEWDQNHRYLSSFFTLQILELIYLYFFRIAKSKSPIKKIKNSKCDEVNLGAIPTLFWNEYMNLYEPKLRQSFHQFFLKKMSLNSFKIISSLQECTVGNTDSGKLEFAINSVWIFKSAWKEEEQFDQRFHAPT